MLISFPFPYYIKDHYYTSFPSDRNSVKAIVYTLLILELAQTAIMSYCAYTIFGSGYGNLEAFNSSRLTWFPVCILGSLIAGIVQLYYAHRLYLLFGSKIMGSLVALLATLQIGSGIGQGVISKLIEDRSNLSSKPTCVTIWLLSSALCDLIIAGCMIFYFKRQRFLSPRTHDAVTRIVRYTVETGSITAITAIVQVSVFLAFPNKNFFDTPSWTLGKLYSNSLLFLLNSRAAVSGGRSKTFVNEVRLNSRGDISATNLDVGSISSGSKHAIPGVRIDKEVVRWDPMASDTVVRDDSAEV
ncbi:hypothetical protein VKT23_015639 [Stygiomarasmius scandens]|uniref:DUF6534 domain-containing protein n=1 Tax=Marasmiellus scandens TaxID=2682957 RepID=A0ABR1IZC8_9AGAR